MKQAAIEALIFKAKSLFWTHTAASSERPCDISSYLQNCHCFDIFNHHR
jgi:hypothetical protein